MSIKEQVQAYVADVQGCKLTELCSQPDLVLGAIAEEEELPAIIEELIEDGKLLEVQYSVPNLPYRVKSFILPGGSEFYIKGEKV